MMFLIPHGGRMRILAEHTRLLGIWIISNLCGGRRRDRRLSALHQNGAFGDHRSDPADGSENGRCDATDHRQRDRNLDQCKSLFVLDNYPLDVAFVNQLFDLFNQIRAQYLNFFDDVLEAHAREYGARSRKVPID
jgi:hypothetical protein